MKYYLPNLEYSYNALEPFIDEETMTIHHSKHHQAYVNNLNEALEKFPVNQSDLEELLKNINKLPLEIRTAVKNNGGGHYNHTLFWNILGPKNNSVPQGDLAQAIDKYFGSFAQFKKAFSDKAKTQFGSGWAWLIVKEDKALEIVSTANQDTPLTDGKPILAIDVWEHAYYLKYQNRRPDYIDAFWNVVNWDYVNKLYND